MIFLKAQNVTKEKKQSAKSRVHNKRDLQKAERSIYFCCI
jgi:hypothetical protein